MERNTVSEGLMVRYDVRNGRYRRGKDPVMGTYTPRILRGTEFYIGPSTLTPSNVNYLSNFYRDGIYDELDPTARRRHSASDQSRKAEEHVMDARVNNEEERAETAAAKTPFYGSELYLIMRPLFWLMTAFGLHYPPCRRSCNGGHVVCKIYGLFVTALLWLNIIRLLSCFRHGNEVYPGFNLKLVILMWYLMGAISSSFCLIVWMSGTFQKFFNSWQVLHAGKQFPHKTYIERAVFASTIVGSIGILCHISFDMYATFGDASLFVVDGQDLNICPVNIKLTDYAIDESKHSINSSNSNSSNTIANENNTVANNTIANSYNDANITVLRIVYVVVFIFNIAAWILPWIQFLLVSLVVQEEFQDFSDGFQNAMTVDKKIHRSLEEHRQRHLAVIKLSSVADKSFCVYVSCVITIHLLTVLVLLSDLLWNSSSPITKTMHAVWLSIAILFLLITMVSGLFVEIKCRAPLEALLNYRVLSASSENCLQMMLFLKQLKAGSSGFTAFGLFKLTKSTFLNVLCVLVIYLTILIHFRENSSIPQTTKPSVNSAEF